MFGMGSSGAAAASEALTLLKVLEIAAKPAQAKAALEEMLQVKKDADEARAAADDLARQVAKKEQQIRDDAAAWALKLEQANEAELLADRKLADAEEKLAEAGVKFAEAEEALSAARAAEVNAIRKDEQATARLASAQEAAAQCVAQAEEASERYTVLETQCQELEARLAAARDAAAKLLGV